MESDGAVIAGIVERQHDLIIIDKHRINESFNEPLLAFNIGVVHLGKPVQEIKNVLLFQAHVLFQLCDSQGILKLLPPDVQFIHALFGRFIKDTGLHRLNEISRRAFYLIQRTAERRRIGSFCILRQIILPCAFGNKFQQLLIMDNSGHIFQHKAFDPYLADQLFVA